MELQLRLALPTMLDLNSSSEQSDASTGFYATRRSNNRRSTEEDFTDQSDSASTSHAFPLSRSNNDNDDDDDYPNSGSHNLIRNGEDEAEVVMGWPSVNSRRERRIARGLFVKAQIEGVVITRKIDLSLHQSYQTLLSTILCRFGRGQENRDMYKISYQDMEGDWLLADHVPWRTFAESVHRVKLLKNEG